ncbi:MAG: DUF4411 family protein [Aestuariivita sp.]|nr:DUF4411 family protein [Aestuariivita sp.]MCY4201313.1 DUF4411 family protein [Aestuariivita sp.]MCY4289465.1 DUF4411 family protein [Aestuariivita sp.]MCY4347329.1 DUF4411 family protein [Aestuariivita sp.]
MGGKRHYDPAAISNFLQVADYWLVSHPLAHEFVTVNYEKPANTTRKVKIPDACVRLSIKVMTPFEMLRHERARFILESVA